MARRLPPLSALRPFEAAARLESFSRAADELHLTHGAISRQVRALEDHVGVQLFARPCGVSDTRLPCRVKSWTPT